MEDQFDRIGSADVEIVGDQLPIAATPDRSVLAWAASWRRITSDRTGQANPSWAVGASASLVSQGSTTTPGLGRTHTAHFPAENPPAHKGVSGALACDRVCCGIETCHLVMSQTGMRHGIFERASELACRP